MEFDISHLRMMLYATTKIKNNFDGGSITYISNNIIFVAEG